ncbi:hypothetical protein RCL1_006982 [Eukaryota sp. TZLM3-RCL]
MAARIAKETAKLLREPIEGISVNVSPENNRYLHCYIQGPDGSPYSQGIFHVEMFLPDSYPHEPPKARFVTPIYHMNIDNLGRICLDILKDHWSPALQIFSVLLSIQSLLSDPNPNDPLAQDLARVYLRDKEEYFRNAREFTRKHARMQ